MASIKLNLEDHDKKYFLRESYKTLRTNFLFCGADIRVVVVTSCIMHEGKSTVSIELARSLTELGRRVLLIDADMRKSMMVSRYADGMVEQGLSQYLSGLANYEDVICSTQFEGLDIIFAGKVPPNPVELLDGKRMHELLAWARETYDLVLLDTPPLGMVVDSAVLIPHTDGTLLVLKAGEASARHAKEVIAGIERSGGRVLGAVLNHTEEETAWYTKVWRRGKKLFGKVKPTRKKKK